ncbi:hypothetical protein [Streptomyces sp. ST2-7A]|uniref:hypothetical protein n=1 Tax=Streptomyces sp. ST2-7A TaxID=2907214 RepID=UPI001F2BC858|nr:hypothetical protein [Streptomyces sp. ST2-7A]MCE7083469.1 hypothetical protein [Streptomyces sp. ST2-7A]
MNTRPDRAEAPVNDALSDYRLTQIHARIRRTAICPYSPVKGGCHRWTDAGERLVMCVGCGLITQSDPTVGDLADLYAEVERLREVAAELDAVEQQITAVLDECTRIEMEQRGRLGAGADGMREVIGRIRNAVVVPLAPAEESAS